MDLTFVFCTIFGSRELGNNTAPCSLTASRNVLCRTNSSMSWALLMLNSGVRPGDVLPGQMEKITSLVSLAGLCYVMALKSNSAFPVTSFLS